MRRRTLKRERDSWRGMERDMKWEGGRMEERREGERRKGGREEVRKENKGGKENQ